MSGPATLKKKASGGIPRPFRAQETDSRAIAKKKRFNIWMMGSLRMPSVFSVLTYKFSARNFNPATNINVLLLSRFYDLIIIHRFYKFSCSQIAQLYKVSKDEKFRASAAAEVLPKLCSQDLLFDKDFNFNTVLIPQLFAQTYSDSELRALCACCGVLYNAEQAKVVSPGECVTEMKSMLGMHNN